MVWAPDPCAAGGCSNRPVIELRALSRYRIEVRPAAARALRKLDPNVRPRIQGAIALLAEDPRPPASLSLRGRPGYRLRVGDYRVIYTIADDVLLVVVVTLGHRRDVYSR